MKVLQVANYPPDAQQSMLRFGELLQGTLPERGIDVRVIQPQARIARLVRKVSFGGWTKWLGYVDKYVLFPRHLARRVREENQGGPVLVHIVDHSNAVYVPRRSSSIPWLVTCHDLLAVRGALGEDTDCPASALGRQLQKRIMAGLGRASAVACDSTSTLNDVNRLITPAGPQERRVVFLGQNHPYRMLSRSEALARLPGAGIPWHQPFLLHVGSNLPRKNKAAVIRTLGLLRDRWPGHVVFAGPALTAEMRSQISSMGLDGRIWELIQPGSAQLEAAYGLAHALIFPSTSEGFGWPVIEAQACGCPVICSNRTSLPEVGGDAALVHELADEAGMAESVVRLAEPGFRAEVVRRGLVNTQRFATKRMVDEYVRLYQTMCETMPRV